MYLETERPFMVLDDKGRSVNLERGFSQGLENQVALKMMEEM